MHNSPETTPSPLDAALQGRADEHLYRPNVGIALFSKLGHIFLGHRLNSHGPWQWQLPQGGIDENEDLLEAAYREMGEEIGLSARSVKFLKATDHWVYYEFPPQVKKRLRGPYIGQKQKWVAFRFSGSDSDIQLDRHDEIEFDAWRWGALDELPAVCVPFKRAIYEHVMTEFDLYSQADDGIK